MVRLTMQPQNCQELHQGDVPHLEVSLEPMLRSLKSDQEADLSKMRRQ